MFLHFGVNTFTDSEWGTGHESPAIFNPTGFISSQWVEVAVEVGNSLMILTAKHHDGFCFSPWRNGHGDVVRNLVTAAEARGVDVGLYLSPWDRHDRRYGKEKQYNEYYSAQLQELLHESKGANAPNMSYDFGDWFAMVRNCRLQLTYFSTPAPTVIDYINTGDPKGTDWLPPECDVWIRPGWFWHKSQKPKKLSKLLEMYCNSQSERRKNGDFGPENVLGSDHLWTFWAPREEDDKHWLEIKAATEGTTCPIPLFHALSKWISIKSHSY
ncbi:hypothetical protein AAG906_027149 [Vitis piasezkii]